MFLKWCKRYYIQKQKPNKTAVVCSASAGNHWHLLWVRFRRIAWASLVETIFLGRRVSCLCFTFQVTSVVGHIFTKPCLTVLRIGFVLIWARSLLCVVSRIKEWHHLMVSTVRCLLCVILCDVDAYFLLIRQVIHLLLFWVGYWSSSPLFILAALILNGEVTSCSYFIFIR